MKINISNVKHLISIITVSYNAERTIESTILSVINQTYNNVEYIVIDGGSKDETLDIIKKYDRRITSWVSEADGGVYDAMNKGIKQASGEWILFLNCGDVFSSNTVLSELIGLLKETEATVIYGDTFYAFSSSLKKRVNALPIERIKKKMPFCHQSTFLRTSIAKEYLFDCTYKICGDYHQFYRIFQSGKLFIHVPFLISVYNQSGISLSNLNEEKMFVEMSQINGLYTKKSFFFRKLIFSFRVKVKRLLSSSIISCYRRIRY